MGWLKKALGAVVKVAVPVAIVATAPEVAINTAVGWLVKHKTKVDNKNIPGANFVISSAIRYGQRVAAGEDWQGAILPSLGEGAVMAGMSTGLHQSVKVPIKRATGKSF